MGLERPELTGQPDSITLIITHTFSCKLETNNCPTVFFGFLSHSKLCVHVCIHVWHVRNTILCFYIILVILCTHFVDRVKRDVLILGAEIPRSRNDRYQDYDINIRAAYPSTPP